ncbi:MAG TPA: hypothetical protein DEF43_02155 [Chloroflexus aurantiacus]|nr:MULTISPECIES: hypothetical protein [Chloroflexus]RMG46729.1 MAG: hypothetical protein D6716_17115 [Chloroflexota bacterium]HBW65971.1 hypothetical protein [Chloroflexus aurantiacus]
MGQHAYRENLPCSRPVGREKLKPYHNALDWLPCPLVMRVARRLECGSHAAAAAVLTIRCASCR